MSFTTTEDQRQVAAFAWVWWLVTGAILGVGLVAILTVGLVFLALGAVLAVVGARMSRTRNRAAFSAVAGAAAAPLLLAWLNRSGPGTVCHSSADSSTCVDQWSPWPFLVVAIVLLALGTYLSRRRPG